MIAACKMCGMMKDLQNSHIVSKFISEWIKDTSITGYIRNYQNPNKRMQDGIKEYMLCRECEGVLNESETPFSRKVFHPHMELEEESVEYDSWLKKFVMSTSMRVVLYYENRDVGEILFGHMEKIKKASRVWADYLLGRRESDGGYLHHIIPIHYMTNDSWIEPYILNHYLMRAIGMDILHSNGTIIILTKIPGFIIFSEVFPKRSKVFEGTRIFEKGRLLLQDGVFTVPGYIKQYIEKKSKQVAQSHMSPSQEQKLVPLIEKIMDENPEKFFTSHTYRAFSSGLEEK